jgi:hypothetical protein
MDLDKLRYPIGKLDTTQKQNAENRAKWKRIIRKFPKRLKKTIASLNGEQLSIPYRPDGWTVRQVVNHLADSHVNSYIRFRWALTEEAPVIKAYHEQLWAELPDAKYGNVKPSLDILKGVHSRWSRLLDEMSEEDYQRELGHPEWKNNLSLGFMLSLYAWHCEHHLAHITNLIKSEGWRVN